MMATIDTVPAVPTMFGWMYLYLKDEELPMVETVMGGYPKNVSTLHEMPRTKMNKTDYVNLKDKTD